MILKLIVMFVIGGIIATIILILSLFIKFKKYISFQYRKYKYFLKNEKNLKNDINNSSHKMERISYTLIFKKYFKNLNSYLFN